MRILHLTAGKLFGGVETFLTTLASCRGLCPEMEPEFGLCFEGRLSEELGKTGVPVHQLGAVRISRPWTVWQSRRRLRHLLRDGAFDTVICHECWPHAVFAPVVRGRGIPLVFWAHDTHHGIHWLEKWRGAPDPTWFSSTVAGPSRTCPTSFRVCRARYCAIRFRTGRRRTERRCAGSSVPSWARRRKLSSLCKPVAWSAGKARSCCSTR